MCELGRRYTEKKSKKDKENRGFVDLSKLIPVELITQSLLLQSQVLLMT